jgi:hypothetical protein
MKSTCQSTGKQGSVKREEIRPVISVIETSIFKTYNKSQDRHHGICHRHHDNGRKATEQSSEALMTVQGLTREKILRASAPSFPFTQQMRAI